MRRCEFCGLPVTKDTGKGIGICCPKQTAVYMLRRVRPADVPNMIETLKKIR